MSISKKGTLNPNWGKFGPLHQCYGGLKVQEKRKLRSRISRAIRGNLKGRGKDGRTWQSLVGYSYKQLVNRLKATLPGGYEWERDFINGGGILHIDHIIPVAAFNFTKPEHIDFKKCWALKNLRLIPAKENLKKNAKLKKPHQPSLLI